ncbi:MAG: uroporphyrinogen-III C-methyltransferase [Acidimicrobiales bacterium]
MTVYLVGAGPGDPGLLTVRGAELLAVADVIVHDRLAEASLLDRARTGAEIIDVGKTPGGPVQQDAINELLVERGQRGLEVVRLKGGDPFVFGRGGEEAEALLGAGVAFEVVPGVTSAIAAAAYAGVPVTHRGLSTSFTVVTGHSRHGVDPGVDWDALARAGDTIVLMMAVAHRREIAERLIAGGRPADTPVAAVRWGTRSSQRTIRTTLGELGAVDLEPPVAIIVGEVAGLNLAWFESRPLFGRRIVITRAREQSSTMAGRLSRLGAEVVEMPTIAITDPADGGAALAAAAASVASHDWVVLTSVNAVDRFWLHLRDARDLGPARVAAIGPGTAAALARHHVVADLLPERAVAESLLDAFPAPPVGGGRVLLPQAAAARPVLAEGLRSAGWQVEVVEAYRTEPVVPSPEALRAIPDADAIAFTSASTVTNFLSAAERDSLPRCIASIGPVTSAAAREHGLHVDVEADEHTIDGLLAALVAHFPPTGLGAPTLG